MGYDVAYARAAELDKERIVAYLVLEKQSRQAAERFLADVDHVVENLANMPKMYPAVADGRAAEAGYRKAGFSSYVALYRVLDKTVEIDRIFHAKQDYARLL